ncbi:MAG: hypothetical protein ACOWWO_15390 [Peptococcaceae bacterium]
MKFIRSLLLTFKNIFSTSQVAKKTIRQHASGDLKNPYVKNSIEDVLQDLINDLEGDDQECTEQIRAALREDNEQEARFWLQKKIFINNTLRKYKDRVSNV